MEQLLRGMNPGRRGRGAESVMRYPKGVVGRPVLLENLVFVKLLVS